MRDRAEMINLVETNRMRAEEGKYTKIKIEQMYVADNKRIVKQTGLSSPLPEGDRSIHRTSILQIG
jgi:hypothetical protein